MNDESTVPRPIKQRKKVNLLTTIGLCVAFSLVAFVVGTRADSLGLSVLTTNNALQGDNLNLSEVQKVYQTLKSKYAGKIPSQQTLVEGAERGLVSAADDPYTTYFSQAEAKQFAEGLDGTFSGIGAELAKDNNILTIQSVIDGSPAKAAGLEKGDLIIKVNDEDTSSWSVDKAVTKIRGEKGTTVKLQVVQGDASKEITITRKDITDPSVKSSIENNIGILRISRFSDTDTARLARQAARDFKSKGVKGIVLDLRGNGGGYVTAAQEVASLWLGDGKTIVSEKKDNTVVDELKSTGDSVLEGVPTVVLIDGGSASASEIVAGALKDYDAATLVGEKSFGKGSVQEIVDLSGGAQLKVTVALWYTPKGKNINKSGINPDTEIKLDDTNTANGQDPQKNKALELLAD